MNIRSTHRPLHSRQQKALWTFGRRRAGLRTAAVGLTVVATFAFPNLVSISAAAPVATTTTTTTTAVPTTTATTAGATSTTVASPPAGATTATTATAAATGAPAATAGSSATATTTRATTATTTAAATGPGTNASQTPVSTTVAPPTTQGRGSSASPLAVGPAFTCTTPTSFLSQGTPTTQLFFSTYGSGTVTFSTLGPVSSSAYNALGFDPTNNYLYAITLGGNHLVQIDGNGGVTDLGAVTNLPVVSNSPSNGAFDGTSAGANYWVTGGNGSTTAYEINVTSTPPAVIATVTLSKGWDPIDFTAAGGFMWGLSGTTLYRLNLSTGTVTTFSAPNKVKSGNFGAAWTFSNGNLGFSNNQTGDIYQISSDEPGLGYADLRAWCPTTPDRSPVKAMTAPPACAQPVDLGITKTGPTLVSPSCDHHLDADGHEQRARQQLRLRRQRHRPDRGDQRDLADDAAARSPATACSAPRGRSPTAPPLPSRCKARHRPRTGPASPTRRRSPATSPIRTRPTTRARRRRPAPPRRSPWSSRPTSPASRRPDTTVTTATRSPTPAPAPRLTGVAGHRPHDRPLCDQLRRGDHARPPAPR